MLFRDVIALITTTTTINTLGDLVHALTASEVFANKKSIRQSEFYQAQANGLKPELMFEVRTIDYDNQIKLFYDIAEKTAGAGTNTTTIKITNHGLVEGDLIINRTRNAQRQVLTVGDVNTVTVSAIASMVVGDAIKYYTKKYEVIRAYSKNDEIIELVCKGLVGTEVR